MGFVEEAKAVTDARRIPLPDDWREMIDTLDDGAHFVSDFDKLFGVSRSTVNRWRRQYTDFNEAIKSKMRIRPVTKSEPENPDKIDVEESVFELKMLLLDTTNREARRVIESALEAFERLRFDLRRARSEAQLARERAHFRATGRVSRTHATSGNQQYQAID